MRVGLLAACDDPDLFGVDLWPKQRDVLAAIEANRLAVLCLGRRSGKTFLCALVLAWMCLLRDDLAAAMRPGEIRYAVGVAVNLRQARLLVAAARSIVERSPLLAPLIDSSTEDELRFTNGTALAAFPCSSRGVRGWPICGLVLDEAAHFLTDTEGPQAADRVYRALSPSTAQFGDAARVLLSSTPWGVDGLFAEMLGKAESGELGRGAVGVRETTREMNPTITDAYLATELARDPEGYRSEFLAELIGSGSAYLDPERLEAAIVGPMVPVDPSMGQDWRAGLDPAFSSDPFGLAIVGRDPRRPGKLIVGSVRAWKAERPESFEERRLVEDRILMEVAAECRRYKAPAVTDQYAARAVVDRLQRAGVEVEAIPMSAATKTGAYGELRSLIYQGELELPDHPELIQELRRLRSRYTAGSASVVNPRVGGSHGDMAQALAISLYGRALEGGGGPPAAATTQPSGLLTKRYPVGKTGWV
jgi:hypothetical protein